jgi:hypothetical protein
VFSTESKPFFVNPDTISSKPNSEMENMLGIRAGDKVVF